MGRAFFGLSPHILPPPFTSPKNFLRSFVAPIGLPLVPRAIQNACGGLEVRSSLAPNDYHFERAKRSKIFDARPPPPQGESCMPKRLHAQTSPHTQTLAYPNRIKIMKYLHTPAALMLCYNQFDSKFA